MLVVFALKDTTLPALQAAAESEIRGLLTHATLAITV